MGWGRLGRGRGASLLPALVAKLVLGSLVASLVASLLLSRLRLLRQNALCFS